MKYLLLPIASGVLLLLCGCPAQQPGAPASASPHATAPTLGSGATTQTAEKTPSAAQTTTPENRAQQDQTLIAASKQAYDTGISLYQAGQYQAAREDFDRAVDIFLTSGRDLKADSVLNDAFEQRVDAINALELDSLQQSNGFSQQDQTPVGVANDVTFPVDPNLLARAQADLKITHSDLPLVVNDYVAGYINYFTNTKKGHNTIENSLAREGLVSRHGGAGADRCRRAERSDLPCHRGIRVPAESGKRAQRCRRHVAVYAVWRLWVGAERLGG